MTRTGSLRIFTKVLALASLALCVPAFATSVNISFTAQQIVDAYNATYSPSPTANSGTGWLGQYNSSNHYTNLEDGFKGRFGAPGAATYPMNGASSAMIITDFYVVPDQPDRSGGQITWSVMNQTMSLVSSVFSLGGTGLNMGDSYRNGVWARFMDNAANSPTYGITNFSIPSNLSTSYTAVALGTTSFTLTLSGTTVNPGESVRLLVYALGDTFSKSGSTWSTGSKGAVLGSMAFYTSDVTAATPEPSSFLLGGLGAALFGIAALRRRNRR